MTRRPIVTLIVLTVVFGSIALYANWADDLNNALAKQATSISTSKTGGCCGCTCKDMTKCKQGNCDSTCKGNCKQNGSCSCKSASGGKCTCTTCTGKCDTNCTCSCKDKGKGLRRM